MKKIKTVLVSLIGLMLIVCFYRMLTMDNLVKFDSLLLSGICLLIIVVTFMERTIKAREVDTSNAKS